MSLIETISDILSPIWLAACLCKGQMVKEGLISGFSKVAVVGINNTLLIGPEKQNTMS